MKYVLSFLMLAVGCATSHHTPTQITDAARGPWSEVPAVEMPTGDTAIPIALLRDVADALLKRPGSKVCERLTQRPIVGLSTEYCSTVYVAGNRDALSWRVTEPVTGNHESCEPFDVVVDGDYPASQVWVVGFVHNHPCGTPPSSKDLSRSQTPRCSPEESLQLLRE